MVLTSEYKFEVYFPVCILTCLCSELQVIQDLLCLLHYFLETFTVKSDRLEARWCETNDPGNRKYQHHNKTKSKRRSVSLSLWNPRKSLHEKKNPHLFSSRPSSNHTVRCLFFTTVLDFLGVIGTSFSHTVRHEFTPKSDFTPHLFTVPTSNNHYDFGQLKLLGIWFSK